jgi:hypothetical protein
MSFTPSSVKKTVIANPRNISEVNVPLTIERVAKPTMIPENMDKPAKAKSITPSISIPPCS